MANALEASDYTYIVIVMPKKVSIRAKSDYQVGVPKICQVLVSRWARKSIHHNALVWDKDIPPSWPENVIRNSASLVSDHILVTRVEYPCPTPMHMKDTLNPTWALLCGNTCPGAEIIKLFINLRLRLKQADWLILSICSVSTNQHAWVWVWDLSKVL